MELLLQWVQEQLDDEKIFPATAEMPFPRNFLELIKQIFKRLLRVYAHIYYSHFEEICSLEEEPHLNTCFLHFYYFIREFELVEKKDQSVLPLDALIENLSKEQVAMFPHKS